MNSTLNKFEILRKDNKWNSIPPEQEQSTYLASVVEKFKDENLNLSKSFNMLPTGKCKGKVKGKGKGQDKKPSGKHPQYGKGKEEWKKQETKYGESNTKKVNTKTYFL